MTVSELIDMLENYDPNDEIVIEDSGEYANTIGRIKSNKGVRAFYGSDYECLVLTMRNQVGAVWDADELDL